MTNETKEGQGRASFEQEIAELGQKSRLVKLTKDGDEFFFDSTDLKGHREEYFDMRKDGWAIADTEDLAAYLPARYKMIQERGLTEHDWGYKRTSTP